MLGRGTGSSPSARLGTRDSTTRPPVPVPGRLYRARMTVLGPVEEVRGTAGAKLAGARIPGSNWTANERDRRRRDR